MTTITIMSAATCLVWIIGQDICKRVVPLYALLGLGISVITQKSFFDALVPATVMFVVMAGLQKLYHLWRGSTGLGGGDIKLFAVLAPWVSYNDWGVWLISAGLAGIVFHSVAQAACKHMSAKRFIGDQGCRRREHSVLQTKIPFTPAIILGFLIAISMAQR